MTRVRLSILTALSACVLAGCIGSPEAPIEEDEAAKRFTVHTDSSAVYLYRSTMVAAAQTFRLYMDGVFVGDLKNGAFFKIVTIPGRHAVAVSNARNILLDDMALDTDANTLSFVEVRIGANPVSGVPQLVLVGGQEARPKIQQCRLLTTGASATIQLP